MTHTHTLLDSPGRGICPSQRPLLTQHTTFATETQPCHRTRNLSKRVTAHLLLRTRGVQDRLMAFVWGLNVTILSLKFTIIFPSSTPDRESYVRALGPTQAPTKAFHGFSLVKLPGMRLTTHLHLAISLRMSRGFTFHSPICLRWAHSGNFFCSRLIPSQPNLNVVVVFH
jgi:hypothetical protein